MLAVFPSDSYIHNYLCYYGIGSVYGDYLWFSKTQHKSAFVTKDLAAKLEAKRVGFMASKLFK